MARKLFSLKRMFKPLMLFFVLAIALSWGTIAYHFIKNQEKNTNDTETQTETVEQKEEVLSVVTHSTDKPSEEEIKEYTVADDMPKRIVFPTLSKSGFIQQVGIDQENKIAVPTNIYMAGWYTESVKPGEKGLSIIDGHRDGVVNKGIFHNIENLKKGQQILVEYGNGEIMYFTVKKVITVKEKDSKNILFSKDPKIENQLNLISCIGKFNEKTSNYDQRIIVVTERK